MSNKYRINMCNWSIWKIYLFKMYICKKWKKKMNFFKLTCGTAVRVDPYKNNCCQRLFVSIPTQQPIDSHGNSDVQAPPFHNWMTFNYLLMSSLQTVASHLSLECEDSIVLCCIICQNVYQWSVHKNWSIADEGWSDSPRQGWIKM